MGTHPRDGAGPGYIPAQGCATDHREATKETWGQELGVPAIGRGNRGSGIREDQKVCHEEAEYGRAVYCDATNSGPLLVGHSADGREGVSEVVGSGRHQLGGGKEEGDRGSNGLRVGVGLGIERRPGRRGGVEGSEQVEWSGVEWGGRLTPPRRTTGKKHGRGNKVVAKLT